MREKQRSTSSMAYVLLKQFLATSRSATEPQTQSSLTKLSDAAPVAFEQAAANLSNQVVANKQTSIIGRMRQ